MIVIIAQTSVRISIAVTSEGSDLWFATVILSLTHLSSPLWSILNILNAWTHFSSPCEINSGFNCSSHLHIVSDPLYYTLTTRWPSGRWVVKVQSILLILISVVRKLPSHYYCGLSHMHVSETNCKITLCTTWIRSFNKHLWKVKKQEYKINVMKDFLVIHFL